MARRLSPSSAASRGIDFGRRAGSMLRLSAPPTGVFDDCRSHRNRCRWVLRCGAACESRHLCGHVLSAGWSMVLPAVKPCGEQSYGASAAKPPHLVGERKRKIDSPERRALGRPGQGDQPDSKSVGVGSIPTEPAADLSAGKKSILSQLSSSTGSMTARAASRRATQMNPGPVRVIRFHANGDVTEERFEAWQDVVFKYFGPIGDRVETVTLNHGRFKRGKRTVAEAFVLTASA
ncbi:hypothetical protein OUZ56_032647 [Daphnia magna]|uniref:RRM domain-containing protein n=1 Tax=Daphnia magna TaxID=35525 RepID=A0ABR0B9H8_9CRUS|nr:hypothetical protein OUZ56_032647 [Daphnia magna]